ncbi:unnamed protein product [Thelazia callipaeda]|uniref:Fe2OG dioxygenase domain-containing protein n=1 Tax=Thelazia callipaeda TaxID=103827 RepID=A0A0N5CQ11_THECL|nr:unnamed protein product [Thelazia callipaeda]
MMKTEMVKKPLECGCKGIRFCALCKDSLRCFICDVKIPNFRVSKLTLTKEYPYAHYKKYIYSIRHGMAILDDSLSERPNLDDVHDSADAKNRIDSLPKDSLVISGLHIVLDFLNEEEEMDLVQTIDKTEWVLSQSGRRKQDYGPRVNFKHKKIKIDRFVGMPVYVDTILNKMNAVSHDLLGSYQPLELCNLEYDDSRWSTIEMHCDDTWIWGDRLISLNLLSNSVLTYAHEDKNVIVYVPVPRRSIVCMTGEIRYSWKHAVFPEHIRGRRIALTMREPSSAFKKEGELYEKYGRELTRLGNIRI